MGRASSRKRARREHLVTAESIVAELEHFEQTLQKAEPDWVADLEMFTTLGAGFSNWPEECGLPSSVAYTYLANLGYPASDATALTASFMAGLLAWRHGRGVYCFDASTYAASQEKDLAEIAPMTLRYLPQRGMVFAGVPGRTDFDYALVSLDALPDAPLGLLVVMQAGDGLLRYHRISFNGPDLASVLDRYIDERLDLSGADAAAIRAATRRRLRALLGMVHFACSPTSVLAPKNREPRSRSNGTTRPQASTVVEWRVRVREGAPFGAPRASTRSAPVQPTERKVRPHERSGHHRWVRYGPGRTLRRRRWIRPTSVNGGNMGEAVVHRAAPADEQLPRAS